MAGLTVQDSSLLVWDPSKTSMQVKLGEFVQYFQLGITSNDGIPRAYIDPTAFMSYLLEAESPDDLPDDAVDSAKVPIEFEDGLPTVEGIPFWERLEGEPVPYYKMFKEYREMKYIDSSTGKDQAVFSRSIAKLAESSGMTGKCLNALAKIYHWAARVKAFDVYKEKQKMLTRQRDRELLENKHATISNQLLDQAVGYLLAHPEQLNPKVAIDLAKLSMESGRLALGLYPDKPGVYADQQGRGGAASINIVNQNNASGATGSIEQTGMDGLSDVERKTRENTQDVTHIQSILHVLNTSGAFNEATSALEKEEDIIDADYEEVQ